MPPALAAAASLRAAAILESLPFVFLNAKDPAVEEERLRCWEGGEQSPAQSNRKGNRGRGSGMCVASEIELQLQPTFQPLSPGLPMHFQNRQAGDKSRHRKSCSTLEIKPPR
ncbi:hypothetical protein BDK51DRAFT_27007 [Blyttiomyces helicus]|uniref:Uncharacterized protein n=1 Tax=Blyttiomyces helicus TaxID=388810 RepID=A0A4V1IR68_9FUNG|nr:hypothetical protein BDK51DRAFT_27007 [Blyttiomyces helicus]|eukprot:RKO89007.1 hypothetical protein BDK51DRAFT_27007 [Blyttiomyces helicus]